MDGLHWPPWMVAVVNVAILMAPAGGVEERELVGVDGLSVGGCGDVAADDTDT